NVPKKMNQIIGQVKSDVIFHGTPSFKQSLFCIPLKPAPPFYIKIITKYASFNDDIKSSLLLHQLTYP
ncbi:hypothetical protein ACSREC_26130, partial [Salmonella enterica]